MIKARHITSMANVSLRIASLVTKLGISLYMGAHFTLEDVGVYGLVFGVVMMAVAVLGFRLDYVVSRSLIGVSPLESVSRMRDQSVFYLLNYAVAAVAVLGLMLSGASGLKNEFLIYTFLLIVLESYGNLTYINMNSLGRPTTANVLFFIRSGLWVVPIIVLWFLFPQSRSVESVLIAWMIGAGISVVASFYVLRYLPWKQVVSIPIDWPAIKVDVMKCLPIWIGALGLSAGAYVDRFIVAHFLGLREAGIAAFYFSFTYSLLALVQSGVLTVAYPKMIRFSQNGDAGGFWRECRETGITVAVFAGVISIGIGVCVPLIGHFIKRPELVHEAPTLWLMLVGIFIRSNADTLYYILFARHQDQPIWVGNLLFLVPAFGFNALLVPFMGLTGIGVGGILAALMLLGWRLWFVRRPEIPVTV